MGVGVGVGEGEKDLLEVVKEAAALSHPRNDRAEVVLQQNHIRGIPGNLRARPHGHPNVGLLQRRGIVDPVALLLFFGREGKKEAHGDRSGQKLYTRISC